MTDRFYQSDTVQDPFDYYHLLRHHDPVHQLDGEDVYLVTRHNDCETVLAETDAFSNKAGPGLRQSELLSAATSPEDYRVVRTLLTNDPPSHTRFRKLVAPAFTARRIAALESKIREVANDLIDKFPVDGEIDYVRDFAAPLPLIVIADFLGVPRSDLEIFGKWSDDAAEVLGGTLTPERSQHCYDSVQELLGYFDKRVADRREHPGDDFLGLLVSARDRDEQPLTTEEILAISYVTLVAGNETTVNLLSSLMLLLQRNPDELAALRADRSKIPTAVEEALRLEAPVQGSVRRVTTDTVIGGTEIPSGSRALILASSANRDEDVFPDPDRFDLDRKNSRSHLSFGKGLHFCLGAALSRLEGAVALELLLDRSDTMQTPADFVPQYKDNAVLRSLISLPLHVKRADS